MSEPFIGEIKMFGGNFPPRGWAFCQGQLMSIAQNTALFSILGITYGGNGQTTFGLPDLRGRVPMQPGQGPGLSPRTLGNYGGTETVTLLSNQMPAHTHSLLASNAMGASSTPEGYYLAAVDPSQLAFAVNANSTMGPASIASAGGSQPHNNMQPYLCINFIIALEGIYPSRN